MNHVAFDVYEPAIHDVWQTVRDLSNELAALRRRMDSQSEEIVALRERVAELEDAQTGATPSVPTAIANLYARTEQLERRANALPIDLVRPAPIGLLREEKE